MRHRFASAQAGGLVLVVFCVACNSPASKTASEPTEAGGSTSAALPVEDDADRWWEFVDSIGTHGTADERGARLRQRLELFGDAAFRSFVAFYVDRVAALARMSVWDAASAAFGWCDHELFGWLRAELVFRGRAEYERALAGQAVFAEYGEGPSSDAGAAVRGEWLYRFPAQPLPQPRVAVPRGEAIPSPPDDDDDAEDVDAAAPPSRVVPPPSGFPSFCLDHNPEVVRFDHVRINGRSCSRDRDHSPQTPPPPSAPVRRSRLCDALRQESDAQGDSADVPVPCALTETLPHGYAIYSVGPDSFLTVFLVRLRGNTAERVAVLGTYSSGNGNRSEWVRGQQLDGAPGSFTFMWRDATADMDLGVDEFTATEQCMAIRCEREGAGHICSVTRTLRSYGGWYRVRPRNAAGTWPQVGAPTHLWDCRPG